MDQPIQFTPNAALILRVAAAIRDDKINLISALRPIDDTTTRLFLAFILIGRDTRHSPSFAPRWLAEWIRERHIYLFTDINEYFVYIPEVREDEDPAALYPAITNTSLEICRRVSPSAPVSARHILSAFLIDIDDENSKSFDKIGINISEFRRILSENLANDTRSSDDKAAWNEIFIEAARKFGLAARDGQADTGTTPTPTSPSPPSRYAHLTLVPGFSSDTTDGTDALGITDEARTFARLICHENATPPLSIGLFGAWGSGKSFFMRTVEKEVDALIDARLRERIFRPRRPAKGETRIDDVYTTNVRQLTFNAWSYADADIWASLTAEIFDQLRNGGGRDDKQEARLGRLLDLVSEDIRNTEAKLAESLADAERTGEEVRKLAGEVEKLEAQKSRLELVTLAEIGNEIVREFVAEPEDGKPPNETRARIDAAGKAIGKEKLADDVEALRLELEAAATLPGKLSLFASALSSGGPLIVVFLILAIYLALIAASVSDWGHAERLADFLSRLPAAFPLAAAAVSWGLASYRRIRPFLDYAARFLQRRREKLEENARDLKTKSEELAAKRKAERQATAAATAATGRLALLPGSKTASAKATLLRYFLFESEATKGFEERLGIVSRARRAFETLDHIICEYREYRRLLREKDSLGPDDTARLNRLATKYAELQKAEDDDRLDWKERIEKLPEAEQPAEKPPRGEIPDRIVLYIDDLDRCRTEQVVKVLEAVHLLLAFESFVVVVGVDARWIRAALASYYDGQWTNGTGDRATPDDYLEKIFQVPYWLPPISTGAGSSAFATLVGQIAGRPLDDGETAPPRLALGPAGGTAAPSADRPAADPAPADGKAAATLAAAAPSFLRIGLDKVDVTPEEERDLRFTAEELAAVAALAPLIARTPRATKRFVNSYRLIRARQRGAALDAFLGAGGEPTYAVVALLLAVEIGLDTEARHHVGAMIARSETVGELRSSLVDEEQNPKSAHVGRQLSLCRQAIDGMEKVAPNVMDGDPRGHLSLVARFSFHGPGRD